MMFKKITISIFLLLTLGMFPAGSVAGEIISGRVLSLDPGEGRMVVEQFRVRHHGGHMEMGGGHGHGHGMRRAGIVVTWPEVPLPDFVREGAMIRVEGEFVAGGRQAFRAVGFRRFTGSGNDPTGVRERLMKHMNGCGHMGQGE